MHLFALAGLTAIDVARQTQGTFTAIRVLDVSQSFSIVRRDLYARLVRGASCCFRGNDTCTGGVQYYI